MSSCSTRRQVFLKTCLLVKQVCLYNKKTCFCPTQRHVFLLNKKTRLLGRQEDMSSCCKRRHVSCRTERHVFLANKKTCVVVIVVVEREDMSSCSKGRHVCLLSKKTCRLVGRRNVILFNKRRCFLVKSLPIPYITANRRYLPLIAANRREFAANSPLFAANSLQFVTNRR